MSDLDLIRHVQAGETQHFATLYDTYVRKIFSFVRHKMGDQQVTEDIVSQTFLTAFDKINRFDTSRGTAFLSRLYTIAMHEMQHYRRDNDQVKPFDRVQDKGQTTDLLQAIQDKDKIQEIMTFLDTIDPSHKDIFVMRIRDDIPYNEIAQLTGKSVDNCKKIFSRTLAKIIERYPLELVTFLVIMDIYDKVT